MTQSWVTLTTNDTYALGALVLGQSLRNSGTIHRLHVMVTSGVSDEMRKQLSQIFDKVAEVDVLDSGDNANLLLIRRPDLGVTFTKLHCWRLVEYTKCVFLDADCMVVRNCDELFEYPEFSAAPDIGWPDMFNSGVFVFQPSQNMYNSLLEFAIQNGSYDGGDQGLLNSYFANWTNLGPSHRLPFNYNVSSSAVYTYAAAYKRFAKDIKIVHFLGSVKPWNHNFDVRTEHLQFRTESMSDVDHVTQWWQIFSRQIMPYMSKENLPYSCVIPLCCLQGTCAVHSGGTQQQQEVVDHNDYGPWAPPNLPSFYDDVPAYAYPTEKKWERPLDLPYGQQLQIMPPAIAHIATAAPEVLRDEPEMLSALSKIADLMPDFYSVEPVSEFPSFKYKNRLSHCPICNESLSYLDDYFPIVSDEIYINTVEPLEQVVPNIGEPQQSVSNNQKADIYQDYQHQMAFERGAIDYMGLDSWENIKNYLDQQLQ